MPTAGRHPEPGLAWAYVPEAVAIAAGVPSLDLPGTERLLPGPGGKPVPHRLAPVTAWAHLRPAARPPAFCPVCLEPVTLKLGRRVRHHFAHAPESFCRAATAEGALHLAAKLRLAAVLAEGGEGLTVLRLCHRVPEERSTEWCPPSELRRWPLTWDEVRIEQALPAVRADLLLLHEGGPVLALEVCASHAVDEAKAARYRDLGVPWLEVEARRVAPEDGVGWTAADPLPVLGDSELDPARWRCARHDGLFRAYQEHEHNGVHPLAWRVVHLYRSDAGRSAGVQRADALLLWMMERRADGAVVEAWLERDGREGPLAPPVPVRDRTDARRRLHRQFGQWARWTRDERRAVLDSPMRWMDGPPPAPRDRDRLCPQRLRMNPQTGLWEGAPGLPRLAWPAPLYGSAATHPVFGAAPTLWADLPTRDFGPLLHALVPPVWLTLRPHLWSWEGTTTARADLTVFHHDGRRWTELRQAGFTHTVELPTEIPAPEWTALLHSLATLAADQAAALSRGQVTLAELGRELLP